MAGQGLPPPETRITTLLAWPMRRKGCLASASESGWRSFSPGMSPWPERGTGIPASFMEAGRRPPPQVRRAPGGEAAARPTGFRDCPSSSRCAAVPWSGPVSAAGLAMRQGQRALEPQPAVDRGRVRAWSFLRSSEHAVGNPAELGNSHPHRRRDSMVGSQGDRDGHHAERVGCKLCDYETACQ